MSAAAPQGEPGLRRFENIDLLRAFAALAVVVYHVIEHARWTAFPASGPLTVFRIGWIGVDLFFVVSGFVIAYSALTLYRRDRERFASRYWTRRLTRILPLYLLTLLLFFVLFRAAHWPARESAWQLFTHLTFIHSFRVDTHGAIDGPNWSLAIEMQFYVAVALLVRWLDRTPGWKIFLYAVLVSWSWRAAMFFAYGGGDAFQVFVKVTQLPGTLDEFAAGILLAKWLLDGRRDWLERRVAWLLGAAALGYAAMATFWRWPGYWEFAHMVIFWRTLLALFFLCVVAAAIGLPQRLATRWLRPVRYLGETSYGIYLWHLFAVEVLVRFLGLTGLAALATVAAAAIVLAAISWSFFEKPVMEAARGYFEKRRTPPASTAQRTFP